MRLIGEVRLGVYLLILLDTFWDAIGRTKDGVLHSNPQYINKFPASGTTYYGKVKDIYDCASLCAPNWGCTTLFFNTTDYRCYGYTNIVTGDTTLLESKGIVVYSKQKKDCTFLEAYNLCYRLMGNASWHAARGVCQSLGGDLITLKTTEKFTALINSMSGVSENHYIGISDINQEGVWKWVDGTPANDFTNFSSGQPNNYDYVTDTEADCAVLTFGTPPYNMHKVYDDDCARLQKFICEFV